MVVSRWSMAVTDERIISWKNILRSLRPPPENVRGPTFLPTTNGPTTNDDLKMKPAAEPTRQLIDDYARAEEAASFLRKHIKAQPKIALVLGSGLGGFADQLEGAVRIPYAEIPHFPKPSA